jgi:glycosyltransferase involved in cell wall biosynthesis
MISVITPAYNACQHIKTSIESVIHQTFKDWELLIINDGSTDKTEDQIRRYTDSRIRYFYQNNKGVSAARNVGLNHMNGDFFCFLDADDYLPNNSLESRYNKLILNPDIEFIDGKVDIYDRYLLKKLYSWQPSFQGNPLDQLLKISSTCFFSPTWMIRRNTKRIYQFNEKISHGEDLLFFIELALNGGKYDFVDDVILHYRKGHSSAMKNLHGLENGYHLIYESIKDIDEIPMKQVEQFKKITRSIIFKSYLGNYQMINALLSLTKKW